MTLPEDVTVGEIYRLLIRLENSVKDLNNRLETKMVTVDVYTIAQKQIQQDVADNKAAVEKHEMEHSMDSRERKQMRVAMIVGGCMTVVSLLMGTGAMIATLIH